MTDVKNDLPNPHILLLLYLDLHPPGVLVSLVGSWLSCELVIEFREVFDTQLEVVCQP